MAPCRIQSHSNKVSKLEKVFFWWCYICLNFALNIQHDLLVLVRCMGTSTSTIYLNTPTMHLPAGLRRTISTAVQDLAFHHDSKKSFPI